MNNTKSKILDVALELFAQKGFSAVSIRDICKQVKIKESTIYYYFENKQSILEQLINMFIEKSENLMKEFQNSFDFGVELDYNSFNRICNIYFEQYLMNNFFNKILRLLSIEQLNNKDFQEKYLFWVFEKPINFQKEIFSKLINLNLIKNVDSEYLAIKFYSPIYYFTQRYLLSGELTEKTKEQFRLNVDKYIKNFYSEIMNFEEAK